MAVKDLVKLYDSSPHAPAPASSFTKSEHDSQSMPPRTPARFINPAAQLDNSGVRNDALSGIELSVTAPLTAHTAHLYDNYEPTSDDISTDLGQTAASQLMTAPPNVVLASGTRLLSGGDDLTPDSGRKTKQRTSSTSNPAHLHSSVPATVVFSRTAAPLHLPRLDKYLECLPPPTFLDTNGKVQEPVMFPPMDRLVKLDTNLEDLETNFIKPSWRNRRTILASAVNVVLGLMGSSALASFYSLQGLFNTVQLFALILSTIVPLGGQHIADKWSKLFLGTIPNVLALNFASTPVQSLLFLLIFMAVAAGLLYYFHRSTIDSSQYIVIEGLQQGNMKGKQWGLVVVTFLLTVIYLPLSTMAIHVLVWSQDLWAVPNPYINATSYPPVSLPLGPANEFRDSLDFCWTTTMKRNQVNYAPAVVILSILVFLFLTLWFPITLRRIIKHSVPKIDRFTELGRLRNSIDMDAEYHRLLARDQNPFAFLYSGFRRNWGTYMSTYLFAKLSALVIVAFIDPDNCIFRSSSRSLLLVIRQVLLLISTIGLFLAQCLYAPFLDPVNNASEWTSRLNYVTTASVALAVALNIPGKNVLNTYVLYSIYVITYTLSIYFTIINLDIMNRTMKRLTRRIDFSIDIFSPRLDVSSTSPHTKRRIWQESITTLLLTSPECKVPKEQRIMFAQARDSEYPPYLLSFCGTPGERHVENLKILREVGSQVYQRAAALVSGPDHDWYKYLEDEIQEHFIGPDCYWKNPKKSLTTGCTSFFGNAWWIPFPPTLVIHYDDGPIAILQEASDLECYIAQNSTSDIQRRRQVRMSIRALDGQVVMWPYEHIIPLGARSFRWWGNKYYNASRSIRYRLCTLRIKRRGYLMWQGLQLGSGFSVELDYAKKVQVGGDIIGLNDDYDLTPPLARFFDLNRSVIPDRLGNIEKIISSYRHHHQNECRWKRRTLSYRFLAYVYDQPRDPGGLADSSINFERDHRVRKLMTSSEAIFEANFERLAMVSRSEAATWWYIFWDDLWRRNHDTISGLELHATDFNPYYQASIAYTPLPRAALESFLAQRGLFNKTPRWRDFFHSGFLNKLYLRLNEAVYHSTNQAIIFHIGDKVEMDMEGLDMEVRKEPSALGTGGGTDHNDSVMRARPTYRWEGLLDDPVRKGKMRHSWFAKFGAWFGVTPLWRSGVPSNGVSLDVYLKNGQYVQM